MIQIHSTSLHEVELWKDTYREAYKEDVLKEENENNNASNFKTIFFTFVIFVNYV